MKATAMTPEQYHLNHGQKLRTELGSRIESLDKRIEQSIGDDMKAAVKKLKLPTVLIGKFTKTRYSHSISTDIGDFHISIGYTKNAEKHDSDKTKALRAERKTASVHKSFICQNLTPAGAKRFASFARTKYGRNLTDKQIVQAHVEWLELNSSCEC